MTALPHASVVTILFSICSSIVASLCMLYVLCFVQKEYKNSLMWRQLRHLTIANLVFCATGWCYRCLNLLAADMKALDGASNGDRDTMCRGLIGVMDAANTTMFMTEAHLGLAFAASIYQRTAAMNHLRWSLPAVWPIGIFSSFLVQLTSSISWDEDRGCKIRFMNDSNMGYVYISVYSFDIVICSICYIVSYARMSGSNFAVRNKVRHRARGFLLGWLICETLNYIRMLDGYGERWYPEIACVAIALKHLSPVSNAVVYAREGGFLARIMSCKRTGDASLTTRPVRSFNVSIGEATIVEYNAHSTPSLPERNVLACFDPEPASEEHQAGSVQLEPGT